MLVATCVVTLELNGVRSLKEKRRILKSILPRLQREYNLAAAEIDAQDIWQTAVIGLAVIGNDSGHLHSILEKAVAWIDRHRPDAPITTYTIEFR